MVLGRWDAGMFRGVSVHSLSDPQLAGQGMEGACPGIWVVAMPRAPTKPDQHDQFMQTGHRHAVHTLHGKNASPPRTAWPTGSPQQLVRRGNRLFLLVCSAAGGGQRPPVCNIDSNGHNMYPYMLTDNRVPRSGDVGGGRAVAVRN
uniref:Uncharacterized protein n=1 Tax=Eutreptiella gymnastica TaxID=73025 RepID=A0A7S4CVL9_9EUGL